MTLATYVLVDPNNQVDASVAFVSLTYFNLMRFPMSMLPQLITFLIQVLDCSWDRLSAKNCHVCVFNCPALCWDCFFQVGLMSLASYVLLGNDLTARTAFVSLSYFQILRFPMMGIPMMISALIQVCVLI